MRQTNVIVFEGNLGQEPELQYLPDGQPYCRLSFGNSDDYKNGNGELIKRTQWASVITWGSLAEACAEYLKKGSRALAQGKLEQRRWQDEEGNNRSMLRIKAFFVAFLDKKNGGNGDEALEIPEETSEAEPKDDDIPF
jgi:single-strand DNA-binding protein